MMWSIYVIQNIHTKEKYIGFTGDIKRRLLEHNSGTSSTKRKGGSDWNLIYLESYLAKQDAVNRERALKKHGNAKKELFKRIDNSIS